ncbi:hypothetical protein R1flu_022129 [Riccia fluitans]|uniref:Uncharacterized protein n=1 Tax=Riccia fluitans TaxID=41844 RepID=A0ABD1ZRB2_9MARC
MSPTLATILPVKAKRDQWARTRGKPFASGGQRSLPLVNSSPMEANRRLGLRLECLAFVSIGESLASGGEVTARHRHVPALRLHWRSFR